MSLTRRSLFQTTLAVPAALAAQAPADEPYWNMVAKQFPLAEKLIYLNAANVCPASHPVMDRHLAFLRDFHGNPSFQNRDKYVEMRESLRAKAAKMLRVSANEIAVTRNTSEGSNLVVKGIDLKEGDEVIVTSHNHPSNLDSWNVRARRDRFTVKTVSTPVLPGSADALTAGIEKAITPRTRVIAITHLTSTTGVLYPAKAIAELARRRGIWMHLDGAQTFGALDVDLSSIDCDSYATSAHKWLMGPLEAGLLFVRDRRIAELWPAVVTAGWAEDLKGARKFEVYGQRDDPRVVALEASLDFVNTIGMRNVEARMRALATRAKTQLAALGGVELKTNHEAELSGGVVKFKLSDIATKTVYGKLWERHRIATASTLSGDSEGIRFSPHIYNLPGQIDAAVAAVRELTKA
ncbi:MAG: aminotransferase class V-fold PLP-dependent enzyme [Acidobacteria bacterium]|nr:aminotransferase class V-fold PLP-dependent enzyme [Acidobacteriota bacterium]